VIALARKPIRIEVTRGGDVTSTLRSVEARLKTQKSPETVQRFVAGDREPMVMLICGYFRALFGKSIDLFKTLPSPIVEQFQAAHEVEYKLKSALA
jgi:AraC family transcriptional activator of mtrCDE